MKGSVIAAAAAALVGGASAGKVHHRHAHGLFEAAKRGEDTGETCIPGCTTYMTTIYGEPTLVAPPPPATPTSTVPGGAVPTVIEYVCPTPGTYDFPATTVTVSETTTVCGASTTKVPAGTHTLGGVTTVVKTATVVTCPVATAVTTSGVVTSTIVETTYACPTPGTYTIAPVTTVVVEETVVVVPVIETYCPGTYTAPAVHVTVTETDYKYYCPYTTPAVPAPTKAAPPPEKKPDSKGPVGGGKGKWAITYTPYTQTGLCKDAGAVDADLARIKGNGFTVVRVYSTDCNTLPNVGAAAAKHGLKMIIGIFIDSAGCHNKSPDVETQINAIKSWGRFDLVEMVVVGNEAIFGGKCTVGELSSLIVHVKEVFGSCGYNGHYTTTETVNIWQRPDVSAGLCGIISVTGANIHAYFNADTAPGNAGNYVLGQLAIVDAICPGKQAINLESGWPSAGNCNGKACPGKDNQRTALLDIESKCGGRTVLFSTHNDLWKDAGECGCEQSWGCLDLFD